MGHVNVEVKITNPENGKFVEEMALVDTGATNTILPRELAEQLQLKTTSKRKVRTANGYVDVENSVAEIGICSEKTTITVGIARSATIKNPVIGVTTLEVLELAVDPASRRLVKSEPMWLTFAD